MPVPYTIVNNRSNPLIAVPSAKNPSQLINQLGSGIAVPLQVIDDQWVVSQGIYNLAQSIYITLSTPVGRHFYQCDFGSLLYRLIFENWNSLLEQEVITAVQTSLNTWLPYINVTNVNVDASSVNINNNLVVVSVSFILAGTTSLNTVTIPLSTDDTTQLSSSLYTINGQPVFPANP